MKTTGALIRIARAAALMTLAMAGALAGPARAAGVGGVWTGAAREGAGKTYLFKLTLWSESEGVVDYTDLKCRSLVKAMPRADARRVFRETVVEGKFGGQCDDGFFELSPFGAQLKWVWSASPGGAMIASGTLTRVAAAP